MSEEIQNASDGVPDKTPSTDVHGETHYNAAESFVINIAGDEHGTSDKEPEAEEGDVSDDSNSVESETTSEKERQAEEKAQEDIVYYAKAFREKMQWDGTYHPGVSESDFVQYTNGIRVVSQDWFNDDSIIASIFHGRPEKELCHNCGWTSSHQMSPFGYTSRVKVSYLKEHMALWEVGPKWFIRDEINNDWNSAANDYKTQELIRKNVPGVPLVEIYRFGDKEDKYALTVMSRAKGIELGGIFNKLTPKQKEILAEDLASHVQKWRKLTSPRMQTADGKPLRDFIFRCDEGPCLDVPFGPTEWVNFRNRIREVDEKVARIKTVLLGEGRLSNEDQYVFTHGDLNKGNIFVIEEEPGMFKISAIIDWEFAGYCPWWVECFSDLTGLFYKRMELLFPGYDFETYKKIMDEIFDIRMECILNGRILFKHTPNDTNEWYGRHFCKCEPYCRWYRSDSLFGVKGSREVTFSMDNAYPGADIEFEKMWNSLVQSEDSQNLN
ncbi:hypothetical protein G7Y89_g12330 [Cudoniella acicularis]|uniref:Aminoglycoside phosphotransferase domain-containing protein n=1 Tax=Cudoniella acicularis TaxID=354080 RepID=A0A8H4RBE8_9HELO|nr:hypothetical protein G7Y89_g12330 [Cudoniella acicularis]